MKIRQIIQRNSVFSITILIMILGTVYYLWLHRKPYTQNAFTVSIVRPVKALVPGYITEIWIKNNQSVKKGDKLFKVYREPYRLAVEKLENQILAAKVKVKVLLHKIEVEKYKIEKSKYELANAEYLSAVATRLAKPEIISKSKAEIRYTEMQAKKEALNIAKENLEVSKASYEHEVAYIKVLKSELKISKINLDFTIIYARTDGSVTNMFLTPGTYVKPGETLFALIDTSKWWIQANFKETELSVIGPGQKVKIWLWQYPGKTFNGVVTDTGWGVNRIKTNERFGLSEVQKENEWFLLPQRFPVQIKIIDTDPKYPLHTGGSAFVQVDIPSYTIRHAFWTFFQI